MNGTPTVVLVLSVDEAPLLERSLPAIVAEPDADVVVVDNACGDGTAEVAEAAGARLLRLAHRTTYAAALNTAIAATSSEAVLLLNADCVVAPGFLAPLRSRLAEDRVGSVAPRLLQASGMDPADRTQVVDAVGVAVDRRRKNGLVGHGAPASAFHVGGPVFGGDGAAVLYRRETLEDCAVGAEILDEDLELWATESDLAWRAQLCGWRCLYEPGAVAWHVRFYSPTTRAAIDPAHRRMQFRNRLLMAAKNETAVGLAVDLPWIAAYEVAALGHALLRERTLLGAYREAWALRDGVRRRRRVVQRGRRVRRPPFGLEPPA